MGGDLKGMVCFSTSTASGGAGGAGGGRGGGNQPPHRNPASKAAGGPGTYRKNQPIAMLNPDGTPIATPGLPYTGGAADVAFGRAMATNLLARSLGIQGFPPHSSSVSNSWFLPHQAA